MVQKSSRDESDWDAGPDAAEADVSLERLTEAFAEMMGEDAPAAELDREQSPAGDASLVEIPADDESADVSPLGIIEAMLFVGHPDNRPITTQEMAALIRGVEPPEVEPLIAQLNARYAADGCPYEIVAEEAGFRMSLRSHFQNVRDKFYGRLKETRLSQAAVEVLAVIAYREPMTAAEVNKIRAAPSGAVLAQLVRRQLLRIERGPSKSRPHYFTTKRFLDLFGLESLEDLPRSPDVDRW